MFRKLVLMMVAFIAATGCAQKSQKTEGETVLFNPVITASQLEVSVLSNGCTKADDFYLVVAEDTIELRRTCQDVCRRAPMLIRLAFEHPFKNDVYQFKNSVRFSNRIEGQ